MEKKQEENFDDSYDRYDVFKETPISPQYPGYDKQAIRETDDNFMIFPD